MHGSLPPAGDDGVLRTSPPAVAAPLPEAVPILIAAIVFALLLFTPALLNDGDTPWQIRTGDWILDHRAIPHADPFSYTFAGHRWFAHEWLAEVLLALAYGAAAWRGVMALAALACALTFGLLVRDLRRLMPPAPALLLVLAAMALLMPSMLARPHLLAWPCMEAWCAALVVARARDRTPPLALLPVMTVWANLHGSFMVGLLLPLFFVAEALLAGGRLTGWARFIAGAWLAALVTPETIDGLLFPLRMLRMSAISGINEWQPPDFAQPQPLEIAILLAIWAGLSGRVRLPKLRLLLLLGLFHLALHHVRYQQLLGIVGALIVAEPIGALVQVRSTARRIRLLPAAAGLLALAAVARAALPLRHFPYADAMAALQSLPPSLRAQPVLNDYFYGGLLIFMGVKPFIDSRADVYGDAFIQRYADITWPTPEALEAALKEWRITWTFFRPDNRVVGVLDHEPGWRRLYADASVVVHVRSDIMPEQPR